MTWTVPEKWSCRNVLLETAKGKRIFSLDDHPLHVVSSSLPYDAVVDRAELFEHLHVHDMIDHAIPFVFKYYERDWGLCCSRTTRDTLTEDAYHVVIDSEFVPGILKVGEVVVQGRSDETIVLCSHLCHPAQVNDGLSGVIAGVEVMRSLLTGKSPRYTYRLLILPETIGSAAYLSRFVDLIPLMKGGIFLEMLGTGHPHSLQRSFYDSEMNSCCEAVMGECDHGSWIGDFLKVVMNDERMFNSPGVRVPMVSLSRVLPLGEPDWPFYGYHTHLDDLKHFDFKSFDDSVNLILKIIDALENNEIAVPRFAGEIFCSGYAGIDYQSMHELVHSVTYLLDGETGVASLARKTGLEIEQVRDFLNILEKEGLITWKD